MSRFFATGSDSESEESSSADEIAPKSSGTFKQLVPLTLISSVTVRRAVGSFGDWHVYFISQVVARQWWWGGHQESGAQRQRQKVCAFFFIVIILFSISAGRESRILIWFHSWPLGLKNWPTSLKPSGMQWRSVTWLSVWRNLNSCVELFSKART